MTARPATLDVPQDAPAAAAARPIALEMRGVRKSFDSDARRTTLAIADVSLEVAEGEFLAIVGPSGCGKSTLLQIAAGLVAPSSGSVLVNGRAIAGPPENLVYLFQQYSRSLLPWRTAQDNVAFAIEHRPGLSREQVRRKSLDFLAMVGLEKFGGHYPWQLSGGMQQRVAIARALASEPRVLLMDEPFSSVDALTRIELHALILELWQQHRFTAVLVTHDVDEAVFLADAVVVLSAQPTRVVRRMPTGIARPRDSITTRETPRFLQLRHELLSMLLGRQAERPHG
jgi:NitT/TauT family transport system ATP-binding protein